MHFSTKDSNRRVRSRRGYKMKTQPKTHSVYFVSIFKAMNITQNDSKRVCRILMITCSHNGFIAIDFGSYFEPMLAAPLICTIVHRKIVTFSKMKLCQCFWLVNSIGPACTLTQILKTLYLTLQNATSRWQFCYATVQKCATVISSNSYTHNENSHSK